MNELLISILTKLESDKVTEIVIEESLEKIKCVLNQIHYRFGNADINLLECPACLNSSFFNIRQTV